VSARKTLPWYRVALVREKPEAAYSGGPFTVSAEVNAYLQPYFADRDREQFLVIALDGKGRPTGCHRVSEGTLTASLVHPREVFKVALLLNAATLIVAHNHPSGDPTPSSEDIALTRRLVDAGNLLGVRVIDHIIVGAGFYVSFADTGRL